MKVYRCRCDSDYQSGGFCPHCNSKRVEVVNDKIVEEILNRTTIVSEIPEINNLAQYIYNPQFVFYLKNLKRKLPVSYADKIDRIVEYLQQQHELLDIRQNFGSFLKDVDFKEKLIGLHKKLSLELKTVRQFKTDLAYIDSIQILSQLNAIENFFNQAQVYEKMEGIKNEN